MKFHGEREAEPGPKLSYNKNTETEQHILIF